MSKSSEILRVLSENKEQSVHRSGFASIAKLMAQAVSENKYTVAVVKNRDELSTLKSFLSLFIAELSVGKEKGRCRKKMFRCFLKRRLSASIRLIVVR